MLQDFLLATSVCLPSCLFLRPEACDGLQVKKLSVVDVINHHINNMKACMTKPKQSILGGPMGAHLEASLSQIASGVGSKGEAGFETSLLW